MDEYIFVINLVKFLLQNCLFQLKLLSKIQYKYCYRIFIVHHLYSEGRKQVKSNLFTYFLDNIFFFILTFEKKKKNTFLTCSCIARGWIAWRRHVQNAACLRDIMTRRGRKRRRKVEDVAHPGTGRRVKLRAVCQFAAGVVARCVGAPYRAASSRV